MESRYGVKEDWSADIRKAFDDTISQIAGENFFGFDINPDLVKATKMNMVMNNDGSGNIIQLNSLLPPILWHDDRKAVIRKAMDKPGDITNIKSIGIFDVIVTNPPFGSKIPIDDQQILEQFDLGHSWNKDDDGNWFKTDNLRGSAEHAHCCKHRSACRHFSTA